MYRLLMVGVLAVVIGAGCKTDSDSMMPCIGNACDYQPTATKAVELTISSKSASLKDGIDLRVVIDNVGTASQILQVCPSMTLCCVKGLHPMIAFDDTGMGLLDVCKSTKPQKHKSFLPAGASLAFDVTIPAKCLPEECRKPDKKIKVKFCFDCDSGKQVESNEITVILK